MGVEVAAAAERERLRLVGVAEDAKRAEWEAAMEVARRRHYEHLCATHLDRQMEAWERSARVRAFCDAMSREHGSDVTTKAWIAWASAYADELETMRSSPCGPAQPIDVARDELRPYLDG
jgi:hypothetical protein